MTARSATTAGDVSCEVLAFLNFQDHRTYLAEPGGNEGKALIARVPAPRGPTVAAEPACPRSTL